MLGVRYVIFYQRLRAAFEASEVGSGSLGHGTGNACWGRRQEFYG